MKMSFKLALLCLGLSLTYANAQVGMPTNNPNKDAVLDLNRTDGTSAKGLLLPKVALTGANNATPMTTHVAGMHVWNTATTGTGVNAVTPGQYFNDGTKWLKVLFSNTSDFLYGSGSPTASCSSSTKNTIYTDTLKTSASLGKQWICDGTTWQNYTAPTMTEWYITNTTNDAGGDKLSTIYRNGTIMIKNSKSQIEASPDGGIELYRDKTAGQGMINGYIDFKSNPNVDFQGRIAYSEMGGPTSAGIPMKPGFNMVTGIGFTSALSVMGGYTCRSGFAGNYGNNTFNINWIGSNAQLWIDNTNIGNISLTSDRRLKEYIKPLSNDAINRIMALKPVSFKYKNIPNSIFNGSNQINEGFIADELQEIIPSAVNGTKNAVDKDGNIQAQTLNLGPLVSVITKALQEQQIQIEELKKRIKSLENK